MMPLVRTLCDDISGKTGAVQIQGLQIDSNTGDIDARNYSDPRENKGLLRRNSSLFIALCVSQYT